MRTLKARQLGKDGPSISRLCLGTMMFGDRTSESEALDIIDAYAAAGGNFLDTADVYANGASESIVGRALEGRRDDFFLATKLGNSMKGRNDGDLSAAYVKRALADSRDRLGLKSVDLLYLHRDDERTPLEETLSAIGQTISDGQVAHWGFSNFRGWKIAEMIRICERLGIPRPVAAQPYYHALYREAERDLLPACDHFGIGVVSYSPLARGVLTGKYRRGAPEGSRGASADVRIAETEMRPALLEAASAFDDHARDTGRRTSDVAVGWVLANHLITAVLAGPRTLEQMQAYLDAMSTTITSEDEALVERLVPAGCAAGSTYFDPRYPYRGRQTDLTA